MASFKVQIDPTTLAALYRLAKASQIPINRLIITAINELLSSHANAEALDLLENPTND